MVQATAVSQEICKKPHNKGSYFCLWGNNSCRNQIFLLWNRFVSPTVLWNPHMLYLHFSNSPMFSSLPSVSIITHEYIGHLNTGLPVSCLLLSLQKEDKAMLIPIQWKSILWKTLVLLRKCLFPEEPERLVIHFRVNTVKKLAYMEKGCYSFVTDFGSIALLKWFQHSMPCKFPKYLTCRRSDMLISNLL